MRREIDTVDDLVSHLSGGGELASAILKGVDLRGHSSVLRGRLGRGAVFLGCEMDPDLEYRLFREGAVLFPHLDGLPFEPYRNRLYSPVELLSGPAYGETLDGRVYAHYLATGAADSRDLLVTLARRVHDYSMTDALQEFVEGEQVVAVMGGHGILRNQREFEDVARISRSLSRRGFLMASGGGPGAMEATHLGALVSECDDSVLGHCLQILGRAPAFDPMDQWLARGWDAVRTIGAETRTVPASARAPFDSLGIPTWLYGHEPPTVFATNIAKYFANSVREDGLISVAKQGIVFTPGSAGTIQEIFQDATQNHYETHGFASPMIFFGRRYWTETKPVYPLLRELSRNRSYHDLVRITDDVDEAVEWIASFKPSRAAERKPQA